MVSNLPVWAFAHGYVTAHARIRSRPEDFRVEEVLGFAADGAGPHMLLGVEKREANTHWVAGQLARAAGVPARDVGYAGMKDRHAVTLQYFTVPQRPGLEHDWLAVAGEGFRVVSAARHGRKLKLGALKGNRFRLVLRDLSVAPEFLAPRLDAFRRCGVPNYFGEQRFGRDAGNLARAEHMFAGAPIRDRKLRGILLSTARSAIFNALLSRRIHDGSWQRLLPGEVVMLDGSHSVFCAAQPDDTLQMRLANGDIHPSGPLWGGGELLSRGEARQLEEQVAAEYPALADGLVVARVEMARRSLRLPLRELEWRAIDAATLELAFSLPAGAFATAVLRELVQTDGGTENGDADSHRA